MPSLNIKQPCKAEEAKPLRIRIIEAEVAEWPEWQQGFYWAMVESGNHPVMAHMLACQRAPIMGESDRSFCESRHRTMMAMSEQQRNAITESARAAGINTDGKFWVGGFGKCTDPAAWVSTIDDAREVLRANPHLSCTGLINHTGRKPEGPPPKVDMAEDLVRDMANQEISADGKLKEKVINGKIRKEELREMVVDKYGPKKPEPRKPSPGPFRKLDQKLKKLVEKAAKPKS